MFDGNSMEAHYVVLMLRLLVGDLHDDNQPN